MGRPRSSHASEPMVGSRITTTSHRTFGMLRISASSVEIASKMQ
jgi:hypothetical protein